MLGKQEKMETQQAGTPTTVMVLHGSPDPSFLLHTFLSFPAIRSAFFLSQLTGITKPEAIGKSDAGFHSQTPGHHILTFNENDPNRWLAPDTNNCIKPLNKVRRGSTLPSHEQPKQLLAEGQETASETSVMTPLLEAATGSTGRLNINQFISQAKSLLSLRHNHPFPASLLH